MNIGLTKLKVWETRHTTCITITKSGHYCQTETTLVMRNRIIFFLNGYDDLVESYVSFCLKCVIAYCFANRKLPKSHNRGFGQWNNDVWSAWNDFGHSCNIKSKWMTVFDVIIMFDVNK